jgi:hypothetical protein
MYILCIYYYTDFISIREKYWVGGLWLPSHSTKYLSVPQIRIQMILAAKNKVQYFGEQTSVQVSSSIRYWLRAKIKLVEEVV